MSGSNESSTKSLSGTIFLWLGVALFAYLFCAGPITRWAPNAAETIYAPLSPLGNNKLSGPVIRAWLKLWGVKTGE